MASFSTLEIGKRALMANQIGLDVTSNNISNVNTPGYSRRSPILSETSPNFKNGFYVGTGVTVDSLRSFREEFFDREIRSNDSRLAGYSADEQIFQKIQSVLAEPSDQGISEIASQFLNTFNELALKPENQGLRDYAVQLAKQLTDRFHSTAQSLSDTRKDVLSDVNQNITKINSLTQEIAKLNINVMSTKSAAGADAQTYVDQRAAKIEELTKLAGVTVTTNDRSGVNVFINGINVVTNGDASILRSNETINSATGERTLQILKVDSGGNTISGINPQSGELESQINHYNVTLDDSDTSSGFSVSKKLNDFANALVQKVNNLTMGGYGLDDTTGNPPGRPFFEPSVGNATAFNIEISQDILSNSRNIPLSSAAGETGNGEIANFIGRLANDTNFLDSQKPAEYYSTFLGKLGSLASDATKGKSTTQLVSDQLSNQRESVMGVNLDEEAVNLIKYQKGFEASSRIINTTNELLGTIINLGT